MATGAPIKLVTGNRPPRRIFMDGGRKSWGSEIGVVSHSTNRDTGFTPTTTMRPGNVLCKGTDGLWYDDATTGVPSAVADVAALITADATWQSATISLYRNGALVVTVILGGADDTDAEVVTALNGNAIFAANAIASASGSRVHVKSLDTGSQVAIKVTSSLSTAFGASGTEARGTDGDYAVITDYIDQLDGNNTAANVQGVQAVRMGHFDESNLIFNSGALSQDAKNVLLRRGSFFES